MSGDGLLLGIDEGTTAVKAALFDLSLRELAGARREVPVRHPRPGWVEQDPEAILAAVVDAVAEVLERADGRPLLGAGLDHQGESALAWDALTGAPLTPVVVWQDKRHERLLQDVDAGVAARSGLPLDPYFSAGKLRWLVDNDAGVRRAAAAGTLRLGTVDAFLADRLGARFATDLSTASRTQLLTVGGADWDGQLLDAFGVRREWLPAIGPTFGRLGVLRHERWPTVLPLTAQLVDQQAALAGAGAVRPGEVKATYGTGVFVLARTAAPVSAQGLLPTVAWAGAGEVAYALDGGVFTAGALLDWLAGALGLARDAAALASMAATVPDAAGVSVLPALAGVGAPWWRPRAHGVIAGLHAGVAPAHVARAALEAIVQRVADIVEAAGTAVVVRALRIDGGLTNDPLLAQLQADALGLAVEVGRADTTVLGAAMLAGVGAGAFATVQDAAALLQRGRTVHPRLDAAARAQRRERWRAFVRAAAEL